MKKALLTFLVAVTFFTAGISAVEAAWVTLPTATQTIFANALTTGAKLSPATGQAGINVAYSFAAGEALRTNDVVTVNITGGCATWAATPVIGGSQVAGNFSLLNSPVGTAEAKWTLVNRVDNAAAGEVFFVNSSAAGLFNISACTAAGSYVDLTLTLMRGSTNLINASSLAAATSSMNLFASGGTTTLPLTVAVTPASAIADVAASSGAFKRFTSASTSTLSQAVTMTITPNLTTTTWPTSTGGAVFTARKVVVGVLGSSTGALNGLTVTVPTTVAGTWTGCDSDGTAGTGTVTAGTFKKATGSTNAYITNVANLIQNPALALTTTFTVDDSTAQTARSFNLEVRQLADTDWAAWTPLASTAMLTITRNGSSFTSNSIGSINTLKITDRSGAIATAGIPINITAYDAAGAVMTPLSTATAFTLQPNATTSILGSTLIANYSAAPIRYEFSVESASIVVTSVKNNADGSKSSVVYSNATGVGGI